MVISHSVVAVAQDPGGAAALAPFLFVLQDEACLDLTVYAHRQSRDVFARQGVDCVPLDRSLDTAQTEWSEVARGLLATHQPDLVITGTSHDSGPEQAIIRVTRQEGVSCLTVLDTWTNYSRRFLLEDEIHLSADVLPDAIAVMDDFAVREMLEEGFPEVRLQIVGQPAFDRFLELARSEEIKRDVLRLRRQLGIQPGETLVVFFSQPITELYGPPGSPTYRGYDEWDVVWGLSGAISSLARQDSPMRLVIRPHPKEPSEKYASFSTGEGSPAVAVETIDVDLLTLTADIVVGMSSVVLVKAFLTGKPVISVQPKLVGVDPLILGRAGYLEPVKDLVTLPQVLRSALCDEVPSCENRLPASLTDGQSVSRLRALMLDLLTLGKGSDASVAKASRGCRENSSL